MPKRTDYFAKDNYYHVYNRGAKGTDIFLSEDDYITCIKLLKKYSQKYAISVIAYCLMSNHYHFLLRQDGAFPISKLVGDVFNVYGQKFNLRHGQSGSLFQGRFQHKHVDDDAYLRNLCQYIHVNPIKAGLCGESADYPYSNLPDWLKKRQGTLLNRVFIDEFIGSTDDYLIDVLAYAKESTITQDKLNAYLFD